MTKSASITLILATVIFAMHALPVLAQDTESSTEDPSDWQEVLENADVDIGTKPPKNCQEWLKFFEGDWAREAKLGSKEDGWRIRKGRDAAELLVDGHAVVVKYTGDDGSTEVAMLGWNPGKKAIVETGFSYDGFAWMITFNRISKNEISGKNLLISPDGSKLVGKALLRRKGNDVYEVEIELRTEEGKDLKIKGTVTRI